ncbi:MAG: BlaI/MecI/CopY family transcriptional regulator [Clostridium sp.]|nr:BlaI/MecI/CopY family transcriptional regulator [Clostridium sp.]
MDKIQELSETELEIMNTIWKLSRVVTASELISIFEKEGKIWRPQTMSTFLTRMVNKGVLMTIKQGHTNLYTAKVSRDEYKKCQTKGILNKFYSGSVKSFLSALYYNETIDDNELKELNEWFSNKKEK